MTTVSEITLGYLPTIDSAVLVAAVAKGFCSDEQLSLRLVRETSWANIRDRIAVGHFQGAHMLAPLPIASNLGLSPLKVPLIAPLALGLGGIAVTVSLPLYRTLAAEGMTPDFNPASAGAALKMVVSTRREFDLPPLRFAVVHSFSGHNYALRYWLAASGIDPDRDLEIVVVPPLLMADALAGDRIDGCCVGEPWNSVAVDRNVGRIVTVSARIWRNSPEKVLGISQLWADANEAALDALLRALHHAAEWCSNPENTEELTGILAAPQYLGHFPGMSGDLILPSLTGMMPAGDGSTIRVDDFFVMHHKAAAFPWQSHALWFYSQMVRWGHCGANDLNQQIAHETYRPDIYRRAMKPLFTAVPGANLKVEGSLATPQYVGASKTGLLLGPDGFFDGKVFDPDDLYAYMVTQEKR